MSFCVLKGNKNSFKLIDAVNSSGYENANVSLNTSLTRDPNASKKNYINSFQNSSATSGMNGEEMTSAFKNKTDLENFSISSFAQNYN